MLQVAGTIGIGLGILRSAFTIINADLFKSVNLPQPQELYGLSWDMSSIQRHEFSLADFEALAEGNPVFGRVAAGRPVSTSQQGKPIFGHLRSTPLERSVVLAAAAASLLPALSAIRAARFRTPAGRFLGVHVEAVGIPALIVCASHPCRPPGNVIITASPRIRTTVAADGRFP